METSLHQQLKDRYAGTKGETEVRLGRYRIDAVVNRELVEIQHGSLGAIRDKIRELLDEHKVRVVKPIVASKVLVKRTEKGGPVVSRRRSPKRGTLLDLFDELVHFTRVFPHRRLTLEVLLVDIEEYRYPGHGKRRRWRRADHEREDQHLVAVKETHRFRTAKDLWKLAPAGLPRPFHTGHLAEQLGVGRWVAQRMAYCFREMDIVRQVGKSGNALLYEPVRRRRKSA
ncbi:hypothetical protein Pan181_16720 [Aeoliella mucimassa]|uniref:DUF8091 domain-containing protein n=2 Tax=Aeoliella mucimassa TaxID=2527972 RepID=A0A518AL72_9BACT|nr:hypothetical protein Pan181_16720 [Aeoliella mucimassa]